MQSPISSHLRSLGVQTGDRLLVHSSFKSVGVRDPEEIIGPLLDVLGPQGTLLFPALSYQQQPSNQHDTRTIPSCVGFLSEYFRTRAGTQRSLHPTHSVCAVGAHAVEMLQDHWQDTTPCGPNSPFCRLIEQNGKILMLGCGLRPNTTMHAIEEDICPPYLFGPEQDYLLTDQDGSVQRKRYRTHGFVGYEQRYDRVTELLSEEHLRTGPVGNASCHLLDASALHQVSIAQMQETPFYFVDEVQS